MGGKLSVALLIFIITLFTFFYIQNKRVGSKQDLLQSKGKYGKQAQQDSQPPTHNNNAYTYNKRKEGYYGSNSKLQNDTYESVCAPEDTEERNQAAQRNGNALLMNQAAATSTNTNNQNHNNNNRLLKRVVSAPVGIETPKGERESFRELFWRIVISLFTFNSTPPQL